MYWLIFHPWKHIIFDQFSDKNSSKLLLRRLNFTKFSEGGLRDPPFLKLYIAIYKSSEPSFGTEGVPWDPLCWIPQIPSMRYLFGPFSIECLEFLYQRCKHTLQIYSIDFKNWLPFTGSSIYEILVKKVVIHGSKTFCPFCHEYAGTIVHTPLNGSYIPNHTTYLSGLFFFRLILFLSSFFVYARFYPLEKSGTRAEFSVGGNKSPQRQPPVTFFLPPFFFTERFGLDVIETNERMTDIKLQ